MTLEKLTPQTLFITLTGFKLMRIISDIFIARRSYP